MIMKNKVLLILALFPFIGHCQSNPIEEGDLNLSTELVIDGIDVAWGIDWLPDGDMLITERSGTLYRWNGSELNEVKNIPEVVDAGQGGLLDVKVHPNFTEKPYIYLSYSKRSPSDDKLATTAVARAEINGNELVDVADLFVAEPYSKKRHHYGSRIVFDKEGYLYVSVGDRGSRDENPQTLKNHNGKIHRMNDDGSTPQDNPFVGNMIAMQTIYSYGHRNPQGMTVHPETGEVWTHEHGPKGGDEINIIRARNNYGWPVISYGINYSGTKFTDITKKEGMEQPLLYWVPSIAPSGMDFVTSNRYGALKGDLLVGSLKFNYLHRVNIENGKVAGEEKYLEGIGRVRAVKQGPDGYIYLGVEGKGVLRLIKN